MAILLDQPIWPAHGTLWAHLVSDVSLAELHEFAASHALPRRAFDLDHYDVAARDHARLLAGGAQLVTSRELISRLRSSGLRVAGAQRSQARRAELLGQWHQLLPQASGVGEELLRRWSEPHRRYHGMAHLRAVLFDVAALGRETTPASPEVLFAAWLHDAVWRGRSPQDENASADLAHRLLTPHLPDDQVAEIMRLVRRTADHAHTTPGLAVDDPAAALLLDADLAVLGSHPSRYERYARDVRAEYPHIADDDFRRGRGQVLENLLARSQLYATARARDWWEQQARRNMTAELTFLAAAS